MGYTIKKKINEIDFYKDRDSQIEAIQRSFEAAKQPVERHYRKPNVYPVQELFIYPDFDVKLIITFFNFFTFVSFVEF